MRKLHLHKIAVFFALSLFTGAVTAQDSNNNAGPANIIEDIASFIGGTISNIITGTTKVASDVVKKSVGIDIFKRGYGNRRDHDPVPECVSEDARNELLELHAEYSKEIHQYEEELGQQLARDKDDFEQNVSADDSRRELNEKKTALEKKVNAAYAGFDGKVNNLNDRFDVRRDAIINKERDSNHC